MSRSTTNEVTIRPFHSRDRDPVLTLAARLTIGMAPWRNVEQCLAAVRGWIEASIARSPEQGVLLVAVDSNDRPLGFMSVEVSRHFSGEREGYIGELVVDEWAEGSGIGRMLISEAESWTRSQGFRTLTLDTGAANERARRFYDRLGFQEEGVRLTKVLA